MVTAPGNHNSTYNKGMKSDVANKLIDLNHQFYQKFSEAFAETRQRLQPGVIKVLEQLSPNIRILDIGCGNGGLAHELAERDFRCSYIGTDFSSALINRAREKVPEDFSATFIQLDITGDQWHEVLPPIQFDTIFAFATLHHIPSHRLRLHVLENIRLRIKPNGRFHLSNWQFLNSPRLKKRIQPWPEVGLREEDVDEHDYLLDWRRGGYGLRYVHHFSPRELHSLAEASGFEVVDGFHSDGKGGNLGYYQTWKTA